LDESSTLQPKDSGRVTLLENQKKVKSPPRNEHQHGIHAPLPADFVAPRLRCKGHQDKGTPPKRPWGQEGLYLRCIIPCDQATGGLKRRASQREHPAPDYKSSNLTVHRGTKAKELGAGLNGKSTSRRTGGEVETLQATQS